MSRITRRNFLQTTSAVAGTSLILTGTQASGKVVGANDRLRIAIAGLHGRGKSHIGGWSGQKNVEIAYVADPDKNVLSSTMKSLESKAKGKFTTQGVTDIRKALEDKTVDAVSVATPNHWHSLITIWETAMDVRQQGRTWDLEDYCLWGIGGWQPLSRHDYSGQRG